MDIDKKSSKTEDVIIVGAGPAGLTAAIYTARADLNPLVFAGSPPRSQLTYTAEIENYPGIAGMQGSELITKVKEQAQRFGAKIVDEDIIRVDFSKKPPELYSSNKHVCLYRAKAVIIATGATALWLGLESEKRLRGKGISTCATCDGFFFRSKIVAVVGGGNTALTEALFLTKFASKVYLIHRRDTFRASKFLQEKVFKNSKIEVIFNTVVKEVLGEERVEGIKIIGLNPKSKILSSKQIPNPNNQNSKCLGFNNSNLFGISKLDFRILKVSGLFVAIGHKPDTDIFLNQLRLDEKGHILTSGNLAYEKARYEQILIDKQVTETEREKIKEINYYLREFDFNYKFATSVRGVFAAGDCIDHDYRQAITAAGTGAAAAIEAEKWLDSQTL